MFRFLFFCILIVFLFSQCTIQKRLYNRGYSVSWNKRLREEPKNEITLVEENNFSEKQEKQIDHDDSIITENADQLLSSNDDLEIADPTEAVLFDESDIKEPLADTVYIRSVNVPSGVAALGLLGGTFAFTAGAIFTGMELLVLGAVLLLVASFVLAIISMIRFHNNRKLYLSNTCGVIAMVIDSLFVFLGVLFIIGFLLFFE